MIDEAIKLYQNRWKAVEAVELKEQQQATVAKKWEQFNALWQLAYAMRLLSKEVDREEEIVRENWAKLRKGLLKK